MQMKFNGDYTKKVLAKLGAVTSGINQKRSYLSEFNGIPVIVKPNRNPKIQVLIDRLKIFFGLIPMGVSYSDESLFIKLSDTKGCLRDTDGWEHDSQLVKELTDIHVFRFLVRSPDVALSNVMVLKTYHLLSIDEVAGFDYEKRITNKFKKRKWWRFCRQDYELRRAPILDKLKRADEKALRLLFAKYGLLTKFGDFKNALTDARSLDAYFGRVVQTKQG